MIPAIPILEGRGMILKEDGRCPTASPPGRSAALRVEPATQSQAKPAAANAVSLSEAANNEAACAIGRAIAKRCASDPTSARYTRIYQAAMWGAAQAFAAS